MWHELPADATRGRSWAAHPGGGTGSCGGEEGRGGSDGPCTCAGVEKENEARALREGLAEAGGARRVGAEPGRGCLQVPVLRGPAGRALGCPEKPAWPEPPTQGQGIGTVSWPRPWGLRLLCLEDSRTSQESSRTPGLQSRLTLSASHTVLPAGGDVSRVETVTRRHRHAEGRCHLRPEAEVGWHPQPPQHLGGGLCPASGGGLSFVLFAAPQLAGVCMQSDTPRAWYLLSNKNEFTFKGDGQSS